MICRFCAKPVVWATDEKGTRQILDPKPPVYEVNLDTGKCARSVPFVSTEALGDGRIATYVSHWATCPKAAEVKKHQAQPKPTATGDK